MKTILIMLILFVPFSSISQTKHDSALNIVHQLSKITKGYFDSEIYHENQVSFYINLNPNTEFESAQKMIKRFLKQSDLSVAKNWNSHVSGVEMLHIIDKDKRVYAISYLREQFGGKYLIISYLKEEFLHSKKTL